VAAFVEIATGIEIGYPHPRVQAPRRRLIDRQVRRSKRKGLGQLPPSFFFVRRREKKAPEAPQGRRTCVADYML